MKYVVVLGDGMADWPMESLNGGTPLSCAVTPYMDELAGMSEIGTVSTIPEGMAPGSDTANLSVMGYDPGNITQGDLSGGSEHRSGYEGKRCGLSLQSCDFDRGGCSL